MRCWINIDCLFLAGAINIWDYELQSLPAFVPPVRRSVPDLLWFFDFIQSGFPGPLILVLEFTSTYDGAQ
jgi:hypothetical protein